MRRAVLIIAALALVLAVAACGGEEDKTTAPEGVTGAASTPADTGGGATTGGAETGGGGQGDAAAGKEVYASAGCGNCHTYEPAGSTGSVGPNLDDADVSFDAAREQIANGGGGMPPFAGQLSDEEIDNVAAFVSEDSRR